MNSTCSEFRVVCTSSLLILSCSLRSTENSHVNVTNDFPVAIFRIHLSILILLILAAAAFVMDGHSFLLKTLFLFGFQDTSFLVLFLPVLAPLHLPHLWDVPGLSLHLYSTLSTLLPKKSHLSQDVKFSYMLMNPKWISSAPTSPLNFRIISSCHLTSPCECRSLSA